jgi:hypothetical protein
MSASCRSSSLSTPTTATLSVNWTSLSDEAAWAVAAIGLPLSSGYSVSEVADQLGETVKWVAGGSRACSGGWRDRAARRSPAPGLASLNYSTRRIAIFRALELASSPCQQCES